MKPRKLAPDWFKMPANIDFEDLHLIPVTSSHWVQDHDAVVSTLDFLHGDGMNPGQSVQSDVASTPKFGWMDACWLERHWRRKTAVCYGLMTPDESRELGCLYVFPTYKHGFDADVFVWVRNEERKLGLDERLYRFAEEWVPQVWPLKNISWPGRKISWEDWYALPEKDPQPYEGKHAYMTSPRELVPDSFKVPTRIETAKFVLVPLTMSMEAAALDHKAYILNKDHINKVFMPDYDWSNGLTLMDTIIDISAIDLDWYCRSEFVYSIRTPDELNQIGRFYIQPTRKIGYDAEVNFWVGTGNGETKLDDDMSSFAHQWIRDVWPFHHFAWPGRDISWDDWNKIPDYEPDPA